MTAPEQPTPEALEAAIDHMWPHYTDSVTPKTEYARRYRACIKLALCLDRFAAQQSAATPPPGDAPPLVGQLQAAYDAVKEWPEERGDPRTVGDAGFMDLLALRNLVPAAIAALTTAYTPPGDAGERARDLARKLAMDRDSPHHEANIALTLQSERTAAASQARRETLPARSEDFAAALECAHSQYENYVRQGQLGTEEERRAALRDALSHAVGLLRLRALATPQESAREGN